MKQKNGRLVVLVASVAVAAVVVGGVLAYRQSPKQATAAEAVPLPGQASTPTPALTPSKTPVVPPSISPSGKPPSVPSTTPSSTPPGFTGPTTVELTVSKLPKGREPQVPYLVGREVRGGAGEVAKVPGNGSIYAVGRLDPYVLAIVDKGEDTGTELVRFDGYSNDVRRTAGVSSLVTTEDQSSAAYAAARISSQGSATKGATVYAEHGGTVQSLKVPNGWNVEVLAYANGKVFYRSGETEQSAWNLYAWTPGAAKAVLQKVPAPTAVSSDGRIAASAGLINNTGSCSTISEIATGKQLWRTCDNLISGFTPDGATAIGGPAYADGYCSLEQAALDTKGGTLLREWKGCFHQMKAEDDQHMLMVAVASGGGGDPGTKSAIIRCNITNGTCELATPISTDVPLSIGD
ncbi:hypothetical protein [Streptomyces sp. SID13031]|uniref:hypothetical protein n=1 Tax=Streptomyces sp. SID13031 TaxID=2706046 RepID=UPI0013CB2EDF|nr:hypothetical protein [Streptomyces sp. SID13031]NEA35553.1 hypothetical protein [Streptomyces sp. SID13031]